MICLQRGCALSASLQYPRGTQVCNMKNTDANKQHSSHKQRPKLKVSIFLTMNYVHKDFTFSTLHQWANNQNRTCVFQFTAWIVLIHHSLKLQKPVCMRTALVISSFFKTYSNSWLYFQVNQATHALKILCIWSLLSYNQCSASRQKDLTLSYI